jgi:hypothetical protein
MRLYITIELDNEALTGDWRDPEVARILRQLAGKVAEPYYGIEGVNCDRLRDVNGNSVGDVWLSSDDDSDQRYLRDMAYHMRTYEAEADDGDHSPEAMAAARLSSSVGDYLAAIGHPEAPKWALDRRGGKK